MLETLSAVSSSYFIHVPISHVYDVEICCPIPRRLSSLPTKKQRTSLSATISNELKDANADESEWEATQELQEILLSQLPFNMDDEEEDSEDDSDVTDSSSSSLNSRMNPGGDTFDPTRSPVKGSRKSSRNFRDVVVDSFSTDSLFTESKSSEESLRRRRNKKLKPKLGNSTTNITEYGFQTERFDIITPPDRVHNPLPLNIAFINRKADEGPEFGLLSVSPPRLEDEDTLMRRARVKSKESPRTKYAKKGSSNRCK